MIAKLFRRHIDLFEDPPKNTSADPYTRELDDLTGKVIADRYQLEEIIGAGWIGNVYRAQDLESKIQVAVKHSGSKNEAASAALTELIALQNSSLRINEGVLLPIVYLPLEDETFEVYPLLDTTTLDNMIYSFLPLHKKYDLAFQAIEQLRSVHENNFVHHDIKPQNFLTSGSNGQVKIHLMDWDGLLKEGAAPIIRSDSYSPRKKERKRSKDIYSLGVTLGELFFGGGFKTKKIKILRYEDLSLPHSSVFRCLSYCPEDRPDCYELLGNIKEEKEFCFEYDQELAIPEKTRKKIIFYAEHVGVKSKVSAKIAEEGIVFKSKTGRFSVIYGKNRVQEIKASYLGEKTVFSLEEDYIHSDRLLNPSVGGNMLKLAISYITAFHGHLKEQ